MTPAQVLSALHAMGIVLKVHGEHLAYKAPMGTMTPDLKESIRANKKALLKILDKKEVNYIPKDCENCPAGGYWDWKGPGLWCFHSPYFLGRSAKPVKCEVAKKNCPLKSTDHKS